MGDAQLSAEYVARAILSRAPQSKTGKVSVIGHSQGGGLNIQWVSIPPRSSAASAASLLKRHRRATAPTLPAPYTS
jgi:cephalosporin-C deacetylase-like acetyl esterase